MLQFYTTLCLIAIGMTLFLGALAAPTAPIDITTRILSEITQNDTAYRDETPSLSSSSSVSSINHPHFITIERLESLLRRAGEIFRPFIQNQMQKEQNDEDIQIAPVPLQQLQPPTVQPYNFYLPPFQHDNVAQKNFLDHKSRRLELLSPPPVNNGKDETNYYASKPKKLPKKFNAADKLLNVKWLNAFERDALADANGHIPKAVYLVNDERNRINFDDSFFGVDMHVRAPIDNNPHKDKPTTIANENGSEQDTSNQSENDEEDLVAVPALQVSQLAYDYIAQHKKDGA